MSLILIILSILPQLPFEGKLTPELKAKLATAKSDERTEVIVHMVQRYPYDDVAYLSNQEKVRIFRNIAQSSQQPVIKYLKENSKYVEDIKQYWIFNGFYMCTTRHIIEHLAMQDDIWFISYNNVIKIPPTEKSIPRTPEWNISLVMADSCWAVGYTGDSIFIGHMDTGIDTSHPALEGNWSGKWKDCINNEPSPYDDHGHGTFTAGIICGGDGLGPFTEDIGVAPGVKIIPAKVANASGHWNPEWGHEGMQWMAALKADSGYNIKAVSNSWGTSSTMNLEFWDDCNTWLSLDIFPVFSIGNSGPDSGTAITPGNFPICIGVGATNNVDSIASFSSRGSAPDTIPWNDPNNWYRPDWNLTKPDIMAPGVDIRSCIPGGDYDVWMGTGMSAPHVTGAAAILCERDHNLTPHDLYNILLDNVTEPPQGAPYPNNNYGWGRLNVWKALQSIPGVKEQETDIVKKDFLMPTIISGPLYLPQNQEVTVFDISGREVDPPYLAPGVYFIEVDGKLVNKVIKIK